MKNYDDLIKEIENLEKDTKILVNKIKKVIELRQGKHHDWRYVSMHHDWTFWYECKLCGGRTEEDRELTDTDENEECTFFDDNFTPYLYEIKDYLKE